MPGGADIGKLYEEVKFLKPTNGPANKATKIDIYKEDELIQSESLKINHVQTSIVYIPIADTYVNSTKLTSRNIDTYTRGYDTWKSILKASDDVMPVHNNRGDLTKEELLKGKAALKTASVKFKPINGSYNFKLVWKAEDGTILGHSDVTVNVVRNESK